jgi:hypothetical protein
MDAKTVVETCARIADPEISMLDFISALNTLNPSPVFHEKMVDYFADTKHIAIIEDTITGTIVSKKLKDYVHSILPPSKTIACVIPETFSLILGKKADA